MIQTLKQNKKKVIFEENALKEFLELPREVQIEFWELIRKLEKDGLLKEPDAKKLDSTCFELRVRIYGSWRCIYAYYIKDLIVILTCFQKKTQRTPADILKKSLRRYKRL